MRIAALGAGRMGRGIATRNVTAAHRLLLKYRGLDAVTRQAALTFDPPPTTLGDDEAIYQAIIAPGDLMRVFLSVDCESDGRKQVPFGRALLGAHRERRATTSGPPGASAAWDIASFLESPSPTFFTCVRGNGRSSGVTSCSVLFSRPSPHRFLLTGGEPQLRAWSCSSSS